MKTKSNLIQICLLGTSLLARPTVLQAQFTYTTNNGTITITRYTGSGGAVTIPSTINGLPVVSIGAGAFESCRMASVVIPDSVTSIGYAAFYNCTGLSSVVIGDGVTSIAAEAFAIPSGVYVSLTAIYFLGNYSGSDAPLGGEYNGAQTVFANEIHATAYFLPGYGGQWYGSIPTATWVLPLPLANGTNGVVYSQQLTASFGEAPYSWSLASGSLPPGLTLSTSGLISGTPTANGPTSFTVSISDSLSETVVEPLAIIIAGPLATTYWLPDATNGIPYNQQLSAIYGQQPYNWSVVSGTLPFGLNLTTNGVICGIPTESGTFYVTFQVTDTSALSATQSLFLTVDALQVETVELANASPGIPYIQQLSADYGQPPFTWSLISGSLPTGLMLTTNGLITGTPIFSETASFTLEVTDALFLTATEDMTLTVLLTVVYDFAQGDDEYPTGDLLVSGNVLYGTAFRGGSGRYGAVFKVKTDGTGFTNVYNFSGLDGNEPYGGLVLSGNSIFGTTLAGGNYANGSIFRVNTDGTGFTNLYSFSPYNNDVNSDGYGPMGGLVLSGNTLYGTAQMGGSSVWGTVFSINTDGSHFKTLHNFNGNDAAEPNGSLILQFNILYGTASYGGANANGVVFCLNTNGTGYTNLYNFTALSASSRLGTNNDGAFPKAGLVISGNTLFGTSRNGGSSGVGTVFAINTGGSDFRNLYSFTGGNDGREPFCRLAIVSNVLYGTTSIGGSGFNGNIFTISTNGDGFASLYCFTPYDFGDYGNEVMTNIDGANLGFGLVVSDNTLFGVAGNGGNANLGTVFALGLSPRIAPIVLSVPLVTGTNFSFQLSGPAGSNYVLQVSTNLSKWSSVNTSTIPVSGTVTLTNAITNYNRRFYRAIVP